MVANRGSGGWTVVDDVVYGSGAPRAHGDLRGELRHRGAAAAMKEAMTGAARVPQLIDDARGNDGDGGAKGGGIEGGLPARPGEKAGVLRRDLEEQGIVRGERLRIDEAEGHDQHESSKIDQKAKAMRRIHAYPPATPKRRIYLW